MADLVRRQVLTRRVIFAPFGPPDGSGVRPVDSAAVSTAVAQLRDEAERSGYAAGLVQGHAEGVRLLSEQADRLRVLIDQATHDVEATLLQLEPELVELALTVAGRVVERELTERPEIVQDVVRGALTAAGTIPVTRVRVHPFDYTGLLPVWSTIGDSVGAVELVSDPRIQRGGCVVDTASGFIDAQPRTRLEELRGQIVSRLGAAA